MTQVTVNGNAYSDDGSVPAHDMNAGGFRTNFMPMISDAIVDIGTKQAAAITAVANATTQANNAAASATTAVNAPGTSATSTTSLTVGIASQTLTIQTGKSIVPGMQVVIASTASPRDWMAGTVTAYNSGTGSLTVQTSSVGLVATGVFPTVAAWTISLSGAPGVAGVLNELKGNTIASAATINLDSATGNLIHISGTTPISAMTLASGSRRTLVFDGVLTLVNSASLLCGSNGNIITAAGDMAVVYGDGSGVTLVRDYIRANGQALVSTRIGDLVAFDSDASGNTYTSTDGAVFLKTGVIADAASYPLAASAPWLSVAQGVNASDITNQISLAYGAGVWLAGDYLGYLYRSADGFNWTNVGRPVGFTSYVTVAFANGIFVAIDGQGSATGATVKSTDGITWTYGVLPSTGAWNTLTYGGGVWVAAKAASTAIATSTDGINWTARTNSRTWTTSGQIRGPGIAYGNGIFVLADQDGFAAQLSTSPDGITWTNRTILAPSTSWTNIAFGNGIFVISQYDATYPIQTSTDGITWTRRVTGLTSLTISVGFVGSKFVITYSATSTTSSDGITWTYTTGNGMVCAASVCYASNGTYHIAAGIGTSSSVSYDALHWQQITMSNATPVQIAYGGGKWIAVQNSWGVSFTVNGANWLYGSMNVETNFYGCAYFNGLYVVLGNGSYYTSPDTYVWTANTVPANRGRCLSVANNRLYSPSTSYAFSYSADGLSWSSSNFTPAMAGCIGVVYGNSTYVAYDGSACLNTSTDGLTWTNRTMPATSIAGIVFASGVFVAVTSGGVWYKSSDGITWTLMTQGYGIATSVVNVVTDGTRVVAINGTANALVWSGTGNVVYRRVCSAMAADNKACAVMNSNGVIVSRDASTSYHVGTMSVTEKVLNDTNLKTYHATVAEQTNFYKRVA